MNLIKTKKKLFVNWLKKPEFKVMVLLVKFFIARYTYLLLKHCKLQTKKKEKKEQKEKKKTMIDAYIDSRQMNVRNR